jgi:serine O-acetyltransferase
LTLADRLVRANRSWFRYAGRRDFPGMVVRRIAHYRCRFWNFLSGCDIREGASLGIGLRMPHLLGIVIHQTAVVGDDCLIMQHVTLGQLETGGAPSLGKGVYVGAGAKILGQVTIGDHARIGANAVVLIDVPANATAVGVPARVLTTQC